MPEASKSLGFDACMVELRNANATLDRIDGHFRGIRDVMFTLPLFVIFAIGLSLATVIASKVVLF